MNTYTITEKQNANSTREGVEIVAKTLTEAKRIASKRQSFFGTVLEIADIHGVIAIKTENSWKDVA